jgi:hypothetical protein
MARSTCCVALLLGLVFLHPSLVSAQSISGTVTDSNGAVVPGVTVEASSPALIEQTRSAVTNEAGRYTIVNLVPGTYTVTFTLAGFTTVRRPGIELNAGFSAPLNATLNVGGVTEVIEVTGDPPLVDVQNVAKPQTMTAEMLDTLPLGTRTIQDVLARVPGGGFGAFGQLAYRGSTDTLTTVDGNRTSWLNGPGPGSSTQALAAAAYEEYSFTSAIDNVESPTGGVLINVVPKDGGNRFSGSNFVVYTREGWASDNRGKYAAAPYNIAAPGALVYSLDYNPSYGGPILRDKVWFQTTAHVKRNDPVAVGVYPDANPDPFAYVADTSKRTLAKETYYGGGGRVTLQASTKDKAAAFFDDQWYHWPTFFATAGANPRSAFNNVVPHQLNTGAKWTRAHSPRLLLEGGASFFTLRLNNDTRDGAEAWSVSRGSVFQSSGLPVPTAAIMPILNLSLSAPLGLQVGNQPETNSRSVSDSYTGTLTATYILGSHNLKAGFSVLVGQTLALGRRIGDATLRVTNVTTGGVVTGQRAASISASLPDNTVNNIDGDWGLYVQDQWTHRRLTVKGSLRFDWLRTSYPDQVQPGNVWLAEQTCATNQQFCGKDVLSWKDLSPRASVAYDLFGNGRTALKFGFARYLAAQTTAITQANNPMGAIARTATTTWTDLDSNQSIYDSTGALQRTELAPFTSTTFGTAVITTRYDEDVLRGWFKRGYTYETNVGIDHQILPRLSASATYYHRQQGNQTVTDNLNTTGEPGVDYTGPFCLRAPSDPLIPGGGGGDVCGLYDITSVGQAKLLLPASNLVTFFDKLGTQKGRQDVRDGVDIALRANLRGGTFLTGGIDIASTLTDTCDFSESPERLFCHNRQKANVLPRISGSYRVPEIDAFGPVKHVVKDIQVSGNYVMNRGANILASWTASDCRTGVVGCPAGRLNDFTTSAALGLTPLGRNLTLVQTFGEPLTKTIPLLAAGQEYYPYVHTFDWRISKLVKVDRYQVTLGLDMYNAFNNGTLTGINTTYGFTQLVAGETRTYLLPSGFFGSPLLAPRQFRVTANLAF